VDDRLQNNGIFTEIAANTFQLSCFQFPSSAPGTSRIITGEYASNTLVRGHQHYMQPGGLGVYNAYKDTANAGTDSGFTRIANEIAVFSSARVHSSNTTRLRIRGDTQASATTSNVAAVTSASCIYRYIGSNGPGGTPSLYFSGKIFGIIAGNGAITDGELAILEDFLALKAGITLVP
jgi:hypothetical protein